MTADAINQGVVPSRAEELLNRISKLIAWDADPQEDKGMKSWLAFVTNFHGAAYETLGCQRDPKLRNPNTQLEIIPTRYDHPIGEGPTH